MSVLNSDATALAGRAAARIRGGGVGAASASFFSTNVFAVLQRKLLVAHLQNILNTSKDESS